MIEYNLDSRSRISITFFESPRKSTLQSLTIFTSGYVKTRNRGCELTTRCIKHSHHQIQKTWENFLISQLCNRIKPTVSNTNLVLLRDNFKFFRYHLQMNKLRISVFCTFMLNLLAGFPGWVSPDTVIMYREAVSGEYSTLHTPFLSWAWSLLLPDYLGPIGPYVLQLLSFWLGIYFLCQSLNPNKRKLVLFVPPVFLLFDATWNMAWLWKDSASGAFLMLAVGLIVRSKSIIQTKIRSRVQFIGLFFASLFLMTRVYMFPATAFAFIFFVLFITESNLKSRASFISLAKKSARPALILFSLCFLNFSLTQIVIDPKVNTTNGSAIYLQDLARIECLTRKEVGLIPKKFIVEGQGLLCDRFNPIGMDALIWYADGFTHLRLAANSDEEDELREIWSKNLLNNLGPLISSRLILFTQFFQKSNWIPYSELNLATWPNGTKSISSEIGWNPAPATILLLVRMPAILISSVPFLKDFLTLGIFPGLIIPWLLIAIGLYRKKAIPYSLYFASSMPIFWAGQFAMISAWIDAGRYFIPASIFGIAITFLLIDALTLDE